MLFSKYNGLLVELRLFAVCAHPLQSYLRPSSGGFLVTYRI